VISERFIAEFRDDIAALGVMAPEIEPKATEHVAGMIELIEGLDAGGYAYVVDGDVYFEIRRFPPYGALSGKNLEDLLVGARVEVDERKRDPRDFALWKAPKPGSPRGSSPVGSRSPGLAHRVLGHGHEAPRDTIDIHGGGDDLIFPHHECEIAQSEAPRAQPFARCWLHNGYGQHGRRKMSKSSATRSGSARS
jgi:cysteinyl-tRNA synthetase